MVIPPFLLALAALILASGAEWLHVGRVRSVAALAFGPSGQPSLAGRLAPLLRIFALALTVFGLATLLFLPPRAHRAKLQEIAPAEREHLLLVLDVSPSMRLEDAGPGGKESRTGRARMVLESILSRIVPDRLHTTVVAVYNGAKPVLEQTRDMEVLHNMMKDLPMHHAFPSGKTKLIDGLTEAARLAKPWPRGSTTLLLLSDGDTVPPTGMPSMPPSIGGVLVLGVGDTEKGTFLHGHHSRQDAATLRQIATRLRGTYHNANLKFVPTATLAGLGSLEMDGEVRPPGQRELAIFLIAMGSFVLAGLPLLLHFAGSSWNPGPDRRPQNPNFPSSDKSDKAMARL